MRISALLATLVMIACKNGDTDAQGEDRDGDGYTIVDDCDDSNAAIRPGAAEVCNDADDNCDGEVDEFLRDEYFRDLDGDGFGDDTNPQLACSRPSGFAINGGDCDDDDNTAFPGNIELCDDVDHDCDGSLTEGAAGNITFYRDNDGDGFGDDDVTERACAAPTGFAAQGGDCDDAVDDVNPGASESCNSVDDDCNDLVDDNAIDAQPFSYDQDSDGYGIVGPTVSACEAGQAVDVDGDGDIDAFTVAPSNATDCNDANSTISPGEDERCDGVDTDCNPTTDEDATAVDTIQWYFDGDADGAVVQTSATLACSQPTNYGPADAAIDCNDSDPMITPYGSEFCDTIDNDCDGTIDESSAADATIYFQDLDGDTYGDGDGPAVPSCVALVDFVDNDFDCDDSSAAVGAPPAQYLDLDEDGYGDPLDAEIECTPVPGRVYDDQDCDDGNPLINPETPWYADTDDDGYGVTTDTLLTCEQPLGYTFSAGDCDDGDPLVRPGVDDLCNMVDDDCDGEVDEDCVVEHCGVIGADEVWADDLIHLVTCDVRVQGTGAPTLTIQDGAEVRFEGSNQLLIGASQPGTLIVTGGSQGVLMRSASLTTPERWGGILIGPRANANAPSLLQGVTILDAGFDGYGVKIDDVEAELRDVQIVNANGPGVLLEDDAVLSMFDSQILDSDGAGILGGPLTRIAAFTNNTITGSLSEPMIVSLASAGVIDDTSTLIPNGRDEIGLLGGTLTADLSLEPLAARYRADGDIVVAGPNSPVFTLEDGVELRFAPTVRLRVGTTQPGTLRVEGTSSGVTMRSSNLVSPAAWGGVSIGPRADVSEVSELTGLTVLDAGSAGYGIQIDDVAATLDDVTVDGADGAGLSLLNDATAQITGSSFVNNAGAGVRLAPAARITAFSNNELTGNLAEPLVLPAASVGVLNGTSTFLPNGVPLVGVLGGTIAANTTMAALDAPYRIDGDITVQGANSPVLTIQSGANLAFTGSSQLIVGAQQIGTLIATGAVFRPANPASPSPWGGVLIGPAANPGVPSTLTGVTIQGAGADGFGLRVDGVEARVIGSTIEDSDGPGIDLQDTAVLQLLTSTVRDNDGEGVLSNPASRITAFMGNTLTGNADEPLIIDAPSIGVLSATSTFAGNGVPEIGILGGTISQSASLSLLDVPYRVDGDIAVGGGSAPVLTVRDGVRVEFSAGTGLNVASAAQGSLQVEGDGPGVDFLGTSATPGHWDGITIGQNANDSEVRGLRVQDGGGNGLANIRLVASAAVDPDERSVMRLVNVESSNSSFSGLHADKVKLEIVGSEFADNLQYGAQILDVVFADSSIDGTTFATNTKSGVQISPHLVELLVGVPANSFLNNVFPIEIIAGTVPDSALWQPLDEDYYIVGQVNVQFQDESVLTVAEGTTVYFGPTGRLSIGAQFQGSLVVDGTPSDPVVFDAITAYQGLPTPAGSYPGLFFGNFQRTSRLDNLILRNAGSTIEGAIYIQGTHPNPVELDEVLVERSGADGLRVSGSVVWVHDSMFVEGDDFGVNLINGGQLVNLGPGTRSFTNNVITANALDPMVMAADNAGQLDPSSSFTGNNQISALPDRIRLTGNVTRTQTWMDLGLPYWAQNEIEVAGSSGPVLTLDPGVALHFRAGSDDRVYVGPLEEGGGIRAIGTPLERVIFTSDEDRVGGDPLPGDWGGIELGPQCEGPTNCVLDYVQVDYAGSILEEAAISIETRRNIPVLTQAVVQNVLQRYSGASGLQIQCENGVIAPVPTPDLPIPYLEVPPGADIPYPFVCEDLDLDGNCENFDYCWTGTSFGTNNLFCGNEESNVTARNFRNPFTWVNCNDVGLDDGPTACP